MEVHDHLFVLHPEDVSRPDRVDEHQGNGKHARYSMDVETHPPSHLEHQACPPRITNKTSPKENRVPGFEPALNPLAPYADGVKQQCKINDDDRGI